MNYLLTIMFSILASLFACQQKGDYQSMGVDEFEKLINKGEIQLVDVRTPSEYAEGHIPQSANINVNGSSFAVIANKTLSKQEPVAVYCRSGQRSKKAAAILSKEGFTVYELDKGFNAWQQAGKEVEK